MVNILGGKKLPAEPKIGHFKEIQLEKFDWNVVENYRKRACPLI